VKGDMMCMCKCQQVRVKRVHESACERESYWRGHEAHVKGTRIGGCERGVLPVVVLQIMHLFASLLIWLILADETYDDLPT
jgi:hypothetical protein